MQTCKTNHITCLCLRVTFTPLRLPEPTVAILDHRHSRLGRQNALKTLRKLCVRVYVCVRIVSARVGVRAHAKRLGDRVNE